MQDEIQLELTSADIPGALEVLMRKGISVRDVVTTDPLTIRLRIKRNDFLPATEVLEARGDQLRQLQRLGIVWKFQILLRHWVLLAGILGILILTAALPTRVLFIRVEGNQQLPTRLILDQAAQCGIFFWADRGAVRSERIKNALLDALPELQWAGVTTQGTLAVIQVQERRLAQEPQNAQTGSMVAVRDGIVRDITVLEGTACVAPGSAVKQGDVLISGYQDCGGVILQTGARGEVYGETRHRILAVTPEKYTLRTEGCAQRELFSLIVGKNRINFYEDSGILDTTCVKMYLEYHLTLPGGLTLPVMLIRQIVTDYQTEEIAPSGVELRELLADSSDDFVNTQMNAGRILNRQQYFEQNRCETNYICLEMLGRMKYEENEFGYGENRRENG